MSKSREVRAAHGHYAAMGYKFRVRIESMQCKQFLFFGAEINMYRPVLERLHVSWGDLKKGKWVKNKQSAIDEGNRWLDSLENIPSGEYI